MSSTHIKTLLLVSVAMLINTAGDILMAQLMKGVGEITAQSLSQLVDLGMFIISQGKFWAALAMMATFFFTWMYVLSYEDLSFAVPLTALTYIFNAALAGPLLGEHLSPLRWAGTIIIGLGVAMICFTKGKDEQAASEEEK